VQVRYEVNFASLNDADAMFVAECVRQRYTKFVPAEAGPYESGTELFHHLDAYGYDQADVVLSLARQTAPEAVRILTLLIQPHTIERVPLGMTAEVAAAPKPAHTLPTQNRARQDNRVVAYVAPNPKRQGSASYARYEAWEVGKTVTQCREAGVSGGDVTHDIKKGFVRV